MHTIRIGHGRDIPMTGRPEPRVETALASKAAAIRPPDFSGIRPRLLVKEGDAVQAGTPVFEHKDDPRIKITSPVQGRVAEVRRGDKRSIREIVIESNDRQEAVAYTKFSPAQISGLSRQQVVEHLLATGSWAFIRQRPFDHVAGPDVKPKSIFIKAMDTNPLAPDYDVLMQGKDELLCTGLELIQKLTDGPVHFCVSKDFVNRSAAVIQALSPTQARIHVFDGPHPAGNVGTHIHYLDPLSSGEAVWHIDAQDAAAIGRSFLTGNFSPERVVAVGGERAERRVYKTTMRGASMRSLLGQNSYDDARVISGSVLTGTDTGPDGFLGFYDAQVSVIPQGGRREFLGWVLPGLKKFSFTRTFVSALFKQNNASLDGAQHGSDRAIVFNDIYDKYVALDVMTFFLLRAILAGEIEEMERLGILECAPEDFALAAFACPSKTDVCGIVQKGLDLMEKEG